MTGDRPPQGPLQVIVTSLDGSTAIRLRGEIDLANAADFRSCLDAAIAATEEDLVLDLSELRFIDCTGITELLGASHTLPPNRTLTLRHPTGAVRRIFDLVGLDRAPRIVLRARDDGWADDPACRDNHHLSRQAGCLG